MQPKGSSAAPTSIRIEGDSKQREPVVTVSPSEAGNQALASQAYVYDYTGYSPRQISDQMSQLLEQSQQTHKSLIVLEVFARISEATGGYVQLRPEYAFCPVLVGKDNQPVALYDLVEVIDGLIDYERIREEFPNLSYSQIHGAISFLRKLAQFNVRGIDIDDLEDEILAEDANLLDALKHAVADQEITRVLTLDKRDI